MTNFKTNLLYYTGAVGFVIALLNFNVAWALGALITQLCVTSIFSGVTHRYFSHRAYDVNPTIAWALSIIPTLYGYANPIAFSISHAAHHAYPDTDKDTHIKGCRGVISTAVRTPDKKFLTCPKWFLDSKHNFLFRYSFLINMLIYAIVALVSLDMFLWLILVPTFLLHFFNGVHRTFSHYLTHPGVANRWWMEFIMPMGGEWIHQEHHVDPRKARFAKYLYQLDTGWFIIKLIAKPGTARYESL